MGLRLCSPGPSCSCSCCSPPLSRPTPTHSEARDRRAGARHLADRPTCARSRTGSVAAPAGATRVEVVDRPARSASAPRAVRARRAVSAGRTCASGARARIGLRCKEGHDGLERLSADRREGLWGCALVVPAGAAAGTVIVAAMPIIAEAEVDLAAESTPRRSSTAKLVVGRTSWRSRSRAGEALAPGPDQVASVVRGRRHREASSPPARDSRSRARKARPSPTASRVRRRRSAPRAARVAHGPFRRGSDAWSCRCEPPCAARCAGCQQKDL